MRSDVRALQRVLAAVLVPALFAACFSEHGDLGPDQGLPCAVRLPAELLGSTVIAIRNYAFEPAQVRVAAGTTVTWVNCAPASEPAHTSTSDTGVWASPLSASGAVYSWTFSQSGSFAYHCDPHPFMRGTVIVQ